MCLGAGVESGEMAGNFYIRKAIVKSMCGSDTKS